MLGGQASLCQDGALALNKPGTGTSREDSVTGSWHSISGPDPCWLLLDVSRLLHPSSWLARRISCIPLGKYHHQPLTSAHCWVQPKMGILRLLDLSMAWRERDITFKYIWCSNKLPSPPPSLSLTPRLLLNLSRLSIMGMGRFSSGRRICAGHHSRKGWAWGEEEERYI